MYQIVDGIQLTRKKRVCHVLNSNGGLMWTGKNGGEAIEWLHDNGMTEASIAVNGREFELSFKPMPF